MTDKQKSLVWSPEVDYRQQPHLYRVGRGEQGVLTCQPYKSELLPHWRFKTPEVAKTSSETLYGYFQRYLEAGEFVGADLARKYLQMGYTRSRRYANRQGGRKYDADTGELLPAGTGDPQKAISARIFEAVWHQAEADSRYQAQKLAWKAQYG